ncbi:MAG TPA: MFS transporter [Solirubrobacteraceae bacterium]|nr:MFS transporter [Solirubrobacteraceae bacterium]
MRVPRVVRLLRRAWASDVVSLLTPLRRRDFALLWSGMAVSLVGDGIYFVAIAWQSYELANAPTTLSLVGMAWSLPMVISLLLGGVLSDRYDRRRLICAAALTQGIAIAVVGVLATAGDLKLWALLSLVAVYGAAQGAFTPAFEALVPTLVAPDELLDACALDQLGRPLALQLIGPATGGVLIALGGTGLAFLTDAVTSLIAGTAILSLRARPAQRRADSLPTAVSDVVVGLRYVLANRWLWGTLAAAALTLVAFVGPSEVLLPFLIKNELHAGSGALGAVRALGGVGAVCGALTVGRGGLPTRFVTVMFVSWSLKCLGLAAYGLTVGEWSFALVAFFSGAMGALGNVVWGVMMKRHVPNELLGRVSSLDWLVSIGLVPLSFALTGPLAQALGVRTLLVVAGVTGAFTMLVFMRLPGVTDPERHELELENFSLRFLLPGHDV